MDVAQLTLEKFSVDLVNVVFVFREAVFIRSHKVALVASVWFRRRMTCTKTNPFLLTTSPPPTSQQN